MKTIEIKAVGTVANSLHVDSVLEQIGKYKGSLELVMPVNIEALTVDFCKQVEERYGNKIRWATYSPILHNNIWRYN